MNRRRDRHRRRRSDVVAVGARLGADGDAGAHPANADTPAATSTPAQPATPASAAPAVPRIKATLFFASADGRSLVPVEQEIPLAEGTVGAGARARRGAARRRRRRHRSSSTIPQGTKLRGLFVSDRNEAFVDLDATVRDKHPGGSMNELFTVYTIVNADHDQPAATCRASSC